MAMAQIALAWLVHRREVHGIAVVPIPGTRNATRLRENAWALDLALTNAEHPALDPIAHQVKGDRMPPPPDLD